MNFGDALEALKAGFKVAREGWNGAGMFVYYVPGGEYPAQTGAAKHHFGDALVPYEPYLALKNARNTVNTWVPSVADCLASDWGIL